MHVFSFISSISAMPQEAQTSAASPSSPLIIISAVSTFIAIDRMSLAPPLVDDADTTEELPASESTWKGIREEIERVDFLAVNLFDFLACSGVGSTIDAIKRTADTKIPSLVVMKVDIANPN